MAVASTSGPLVVPPTFVPVALADGGAATTAGCAIAPTGASDALYACSGAGVPGQPGVLFTALFDSNGTMLRSTRDVVGSFGDPQPMEVPLPDGGEVLAVGLPDFGETVDLLMDPLGAHVSQTWAPAAPYEVSAGFATVGGHLGLFQSFFEDGGAWTVTVKDDAAGSACPVVQGARAVNINYAKPLPSPPGLLTVVFASDGGEGPGVYVSQMPWP